MEKKNNTIINLQPIFNQQNENLNLNLNSIFLYLFALFELIIIIFILYYFFKFEILFLYNLILGKSSYTKEDKNIYNTFMAQFKKIIETKKYCKKKNNLYYPVYDNDKNMKSLDGNDIFFDTEEKCNSLFSI